MPQFSPRNPVRQKLAGGEFVLCMGLRQARTADIAMIAASCGFDAIYVDIEHSPVSLESTSTICIGALAAGITPLVRVPGHDLDMATRVLDGGALGVIFPKVETAAQAASMVAACRYPPLGNRSVMGSGPSLGYRAMPLREVNDTLSSDTLVIAMLETAEGIANADAIAAVDGVDCLLIGANDLSTALGVPGELRHAKLREAFGHAAAACKAHRKAMGIGGVRGDVALQSELFQMGGKFIIAGSDVSYLASAARTDVQALRALGATKTSRPV